MAPVLWKFNSAHAHPMQSKVDHFVNLCFSQELLYEHQNSGALRSCLTVDNVKRLLGLFHNYQGHFPWLHIPSFDLFNTYDGRLVILACSSAIYSNRVSRTEVRCAVLFYVQKLGLKKHHESSFIILQKL